MFMDTKVNIFEEELGHFQQFVATKQGILRFRVFFSFF